MHTHTHTHRRDVNLTGNLCVHMKNANVNDTLTFEPYNLKKILHEKTLYYSASKSSGVKLH